MPIPIRADFDARMVRAAARRSRGWASGQAASGDVRDLRRLEPDGGGLVLRGDDTDRS